MTVIKRYPNRKLYDTHAKQYVSLDDIAEMIRRGDEVQVVDYASGDDVTTLMLVQIIVEQEKQRSGFLPQPVLTGLIRAGGNTLSALRKGLSAPLDLLRQVDDEIERRVNQLVSLGDMAEDEGRRLVHKLRMLGAPLAAPAVMDEGQLEAELRARNVPTREEMQALSTLIEQLAAEVDSLRQRNNASSSGRPETTPPTG
jgi:polyhydroxyalkanoate synthesis repressor PhaR